MGTCKIFPLFNQLQKFLFISVSISVINCAEKGSAIAKSPVSVKSTIVLINWKIPTAKAKFQLELKLVSNVPVKV